jgi:hypothetical protein
LTPVTIAQLRVTPTADLMTAARALGLGRTKAYDLARRQQFPCRVLRSATPTVSPPRACSSSSASLLTSQTEALPAGEFEGGELGDDNRASMPGPLLVTVPPAAADGGAAKQSFAIPVAERGSGPR